jgi:hypothetical protein
VGVTPSDLTGTERAVLLVLMAESRPLPNPDLVALGPKLDKPSRDKLNNLGLIDSYRDSNRFVHELTDKGWHLCRDIVAAAPPPRSTGPAKTLYTVLNSLSRYLTSADLSLADVFGHTDDAPPLDDRIRRAYTDLSPRSGGWVSLTRLRAVLADTDRADVDDALRTLARTPGVSLIPEENQKVLTAADRDAAITIGPENKHLIAIET